MTGRGWKTVALVCLPISIASIGLLVFHGRTDGLDRAGIVTRIKPLNQLTAVRYTVQRVVGIKEAKQPFGEESLLLMVQGDVLAGVDLADLRPEDVRVLQDRTVIVQLPPPRILETFIDEKNTKVWDRQITWWTPWVGYDPDLEHRARLAALEEIRKAAIDDGILATAGKNAQTSIRAFLDTMRIEVKFGGT